jgi:hypothetical protein
MSLSGKLIQCWSDHDDYVCSHDGVVVSGGDGMDFGTRVPIARRASVPVVMSCLVQH